jgi:nicotinamidase-related amidase
MQTALLIIDVQQGLCEGNEAAFDSKLVIERINQVARRLG